MFRLMLIALLGLALQGCAAAAVTFAGANVVSLMQSDKTAVDHTVSLIAEKDCSVLHAAEKEDYCQPIPVTGPADQVAALAGQVYCYRTLGGVQCYDRPDYGASAETRINYAYGLIPAGGDRHGAAPDLAARQGKPPASRSPQTASRPPVGERSLGPAARPLAPLRSAPGTGTY